MFTCAACKEEVLEVWYSHSVMWCAVCYLKNKREMEMSNAFNATQTESI